MTDTFSGNGVPQSGFEATSISCSQKAIGEAMYDHVVNGGEIDQVKENYEGYRDTHPFHYDFRIPIAGRHIYVETVFDETKMGPTITVVSIKDV